MSILDGNSRPGNAKVYGSQREMDLEKENERLKEQIAYLKTHQAQDTCPSCGCNELLCGYPNNCSSEKGE